ncbi:unnamed protein product, partial [Trichogramma brassicae]
SARMRQGETANDFYDYINVLLGGAETALKEEVGEGYTDDMLKALTSIALDMFIKGLPADICRSVDAIKPKDLEEALKEAVRIEQRMAAHIIPDTRYQRYPKEGNSSHHQPPRPYYPEESRSQHRNEHAPFVGYINGQGDYYPEYVEFNEHPPMPVEEYPQPDEHCPWIGYVQTQQPRYGHAARPVYPYSFNRQEYDRNQANYSRNPDYNPYPYGPVFNREKYPGHTILEEMNQ